MRQKLEETLLWFLRRPSVIGTEKALCDDLEARIRTYEDWRIERVANNLAVHRAAPDTARDRLVLAGHLDTVPEPDGGIPVRTEGAKVYGRGASDMKAGDAVMLSLLEEFPWDDSYLEPVFVFYEKEEGLYEENGLEMLFTECPWVLDAELALCLEPTSGALEAGCVGTAQVEVMFHGKPSHSARPWLGENALTAAGGFLKELHERPAEEVIVDGLPFYEVLTPTLARGGRARNVVPDGFWVNVNHRFAPGKGLADVERLFDRLLEGSAASYEVTDFAPSGPVELDNPLLQELIGSGIEVRPKQAWTDVARFAGRGVSAANFGPGIPEQAHREAEHAELPLLEGCYGRLADLFRSGSRD